MNLFNEDMLTWLLFMVRKTERVLKQTGDITITQYRIMQHIKRQEDTSTHSNYAIKALAEKLSLTPAAVSSAIKVLEQRHLLNRSNNEQDGRAVTLEATEKSVAFLRDADNTLVNLIKDFLIPVQATDMKTIVHTSITSAYNRRTLRMDAGNVRVDIAYIEIMLDAYNTLSDRATRRDLTFPKALVLFLVTNNPQALSRSEIAKSALLPYSNVSQIVESLKQGGYLLDSAFEDTGKTSRVALAPRGSTLAATLSEDFNAAMLNEIYQHPTEEHDMFVRACRAIVRRERLHYV